MNRSQDQESGQMAQELRCIVQMGLNMKFVPLQRKILIFPKWDLEVTELGHSFMYSFIHTISEHPLHTMNLMVPKEPFFPSLWGPPIWILGSALWLAGASRMEQV